MTLVTRRPNFSVVPFCHNAGVKNTAFLNGTNSWNAVAYAYICTAHKYPVSGDLKL